MATLNAHLEYDWSGYPIPENIELRGQVYIESGYAFGGFASQRRPGLIMEDGSGAYGLTSFVVGREGRIHVGAYTCLSSAALRCYDHLSIGAHCLLAWGSVISDLIVPRPEDWKFRRNAMIALGEDPSRNLPPLGEVRPTFLEDNVWVGFHAYVGAGVRVGRGSAVSCKSVVTADVPPYTVVAGNPAKIIARLDPDDTPEARAAALRSFGLAVPPQTP